MTVAFKTPCGRQSSHKKYHNVMLLKSVSSFLLVCGTVHFCYSPQVKVWRYCDTAPVSAVVRPPDQDVQQDVPELYRQLIELGIALELSSLLKSLWTYYIVPEMSGLSLMAKITTKQQHIRRAHSAVISQQQWSDCAAKNNLMNSEASPKWARRLTCTSRMQQLFSTLPFLIGPPVAQRPVGLR